MSEPTRVSLPASRDDLGSLAAGDPVLISGTVHTARDATHQWMADVLDETRALPEGLAGQVLFYAGPTPPARGRPAGAIGPTTARRMDIWTPRLLEAGIVATIGKGPRSAEVVDACRATGSVYFAALGGAAALLAQHVTAAETVARADLGPEALVRLTLVDFPAFVGVDSRGGDLFADASRERVR